MSYDVKLPDIGEGVAEGEIVRWLVRVGDGVKEDQPLVEVMTDKASVEIPSPRTGTIEAILVEEGAVVPVGTVLVSIAVAGGGAAASAPAAAHAAAGSTTTATKTAVAPAPAGAPAGGGSGAAVRIEATPAVRALAKELGVALEKVAGTGASGRITASLPALSGPKQSPRSPWA